MSNRGTNLSFSSKAVEHEFANGFDLVCAMLCKADEQFQTNLLRRLRARDPKLADELEAKIRTLH